MSRERQFTREDLLGFQPRHSTFVGIDSDGCVFPTMEIKQKQCFHGLIVSHWRLEAIERYVRETAEFVNLRSVHRGQNRFPCLLLTFDLLRDRPEVRASGVEVPRLAVLWRFVESGHPLSNGALEAEVRATGDADLASVLAWSQAVSRKIEETVKRIPPYRWALSGLERIRQHSDAICVSQTPTEALVREWKENELLGYVSVIAGQELGSKREHLEMATAGRYAADRVLMIGDALGDLKAAQGAGVSFYPINPGAEEQSWERFHEEAYDRFLGGTYRGAYEEEQLRDFLARLPPTPPWLAGGGG